MSGGRRRPSRGFTIVETMIVLGVSMFLFVGAVALINGRQHRTAFTQAIRNVQTQLQATINEVGSGYYPNDGTLTCTDGGGAPVLDVGGTDSQGSNIGCLFLGKVIQFGISATDPQQYNVYTLVGAKSGVTGSTVSLSGSGARVVAKGTGDLATNIPDMFDTKKLQYGLTVSKMYYNNNPANNIGAVAFVTNLTSLGAGDGSQQIDVVAINGTNIGRTKLVGVTDINNRIASGTLNPTDGVQICFNSGGSQQSGLITIGGSDRQGSVGIDKIFATKDCI